MSLLRPFRSSDLFRFNNVNLDHWTETYTLNFYLSYLCQWPDLCFVQTAPTPSSAYPSPRLPSPPTPRIMGYVIAKAEGRESPAGPKDRLKERHGHVTAITVAPEYRRLGLAQGMMARLEAASSSSYAAYFVDLFVRPSNTTAVRMYRDMGYDVYRRVREYYSGGGPGGRDEDGYDMRKALARDVKRETVRESKRGMNVVVEPRSIGFAPAYRD